jgi:hypothetical protein
MTIPSSLRALACLLLLFIPSACATTGSTGTTETPGTEGDTGTETSSETWTIEVLPAAPFPAEPPSTPARGQEPTLEQVSSVPNEITDEGVWFVSNGLELPERGPASLPDSVPRQLRESLLVRAFEGGDSLFLLYGQTEFNARYLVAADPRTYEFRYGYDLQGWRNPPDLQGNTLTLQEIIWAVEEDGVLYVSLGHRTYAKESGGRNAYVTAIDPRMDRILWRSLPLVANSRNFLVLGDLILTGYGFTAEPDFLYLLDRGTGEVVGRHPVKSAPEHILLKDGLLYVRCYNTDDVFRLRP